MADLDTRSVSARLQLEVDETEPADIILQLAVAEDESLALTERFTVIGPDGALDAQVVAMPYSGRAHRFTARPGSYEVTYTASVSGRAAPARVTDSDAILFLRPSRYAESDRLVATAAREFAGISEPRELVAAVTSWVGTRLTYLPGSSRPTDGSVEALLSREGVCRDYAQLVIALLRARDIPARIAAVYAPGLSPMDFHAVAEVAIDDEWYVVDATMLAPRQSLVRISTGRDAADTAFLSTYGGHVTLLDTRVSAVVAGSLPADDVKSLVQLG
ncbi:MAG TPA: transglutaminase family protein [Mycobacteriales bacterium]|jgi:transglutaminase-like putative cysteine protease|nr:transglutaminase family protein [Mycobacteriales bacterium]